MQGDPRHERRSLTDLLEEAERRKSDFTELMSERRSAYDYVTEAVEAPRPRAGL